MLKAILNFFKNSKNESPLSITESKEKAEINVEETSSISEQKEVTKSEETPKKATETKTGAKNHPETPLKNINFDELINETINFGSISLSSPDFVGEAVCSKNQNYILSWLDADIWDDGSHMGDRNSGKGSALLISRNQQHTLFEQIQRPAYGKVSNVGTFIVTDVTFKQSYNLILAFKPKQTIPFFKHKLNAHVYNQWISDDGKMCAIQACNSDSADAEKFFLFDLEQQKILFNEKLKTGRWVEDVDFLSSKEIAIINEYGKFKYDSTGKFLDLQKWQKAYIDGLKKKALSGNGYSPKVLAKIYRAIGEAYQEVDNKEEAISYYEKALYKDPKVGVKMKLKKLKKDQSQN